MFCASFAIVPGDQEILSFHIYLSPVAYLSFKNLEWELGGGGGAKVVNNSKES